MRTNGTQKPARRILIWVLLVFAAVLLIAVWRCFPRTLDRMGMPLDQCVKLEVLISNGYDHAQFSLTPDDPAFDSLLTLFQDRKFGSFPFSPKELFQDAQEFVRQAGTPVGGLFPPKYTWQVTLLAENGNSLTVKAPEARLSLVNDGRSHRISTDGQADWWKLVWDTVSPLETLDAPAHWYL